MRRNLNSKSKLSTTKCKPPWIPPPAKTTRAKEKSKRSKENDLRGADNLHFYSQLCGAVDLKDDFDNRKVSSNDNFHKTTERLETLNISQQKSLDNSIHRLEKLKEDLRSAVPQESENYTDIRPIVSDFEFTGNQHVNEEVVDQKSLLMHKLKDFEANSYMLRHLLKDSSCLRDQCRDYLRNQNVDTTTKDNLDVGNRDKTEIAEYKESQNQDYDLLDKVRDLENTINNMQRENEAVKSRNKILEGNRANLQTELHRREASLNRTGTQPKELSHEKESNIIKKLEREIETVKQNFFTEKEALKKVIRVEREKSNKNSETLKMLSAKLIHKKSQLKKMAFDCHKNKTECEHLIKIRDLAESELSVLRENVGGLEKTIKKLQSDKPMDNIDGTKQVDFSYGYESAEEASKRLNTMDRSCQFADQSGINQQFSDQSKLIFDLTSKIEGQAEQIERLTKSTKFKGKDDVKNGQMINELNKKIQDGEQKNFELSLKLAKVEEALQYAKLRLEEKSSDMEASKKQQEDRMSDVRTQNQVLQNKVHELERNNQAIKSERDAAKYKLKNDTDELRHSKQESERNVSLKINELRDKLEHSQTTNKSLQNYITFLKSSYTNVFSDPVLSAMGTPLKPS